MAELNTTSFSLFTRPDGYTVEDFIQFDLLLTESHTLETSVAERSVENGVTISDHIYNKPRSGSLTGLVTNYSIYRAPKDGSDAAKDVQLGFEPDPQIILYAGRRGSNPAKEVYEDLKALRDRRVPVDIVTGLELYKSVVITSINVERSEESGDALEFQLDFQEIKVVTLDSAKIATKLIPKVETPKGKQSKAQSGKGRVVGSKKVVKK